MGPYVNGESIGFEDAAHKAIWRVKSGDLKTYSVVPRTSKDTFTCEGRFDKLPETTPGHLLTKMLSTLISLREQLKLVTKDM